jgi:hypothetical protein
MKHVQLFEDFKEGPMEKPKGFLSKMFTGAKHAMGLENTEDRKSLDSLYRAVSPNAQQYGFVTNIRELQPGVIVAWVNDTSVTVNKNTPEIMYKGKTLDLHNTQMEADYLYSRLLRIKEQG